MPRAAPALLAALFALSFAACPPPTVLAEAAHSGEAKKVEKKPDILSPRFDLTIWTIVVFALLLLVLRKWAWGPVLHGLHSREENIRKALEEAERAKKETAELRARHEAEMVKAQEVVRQTIEDGRRDAQRVADEVLAKAKTEIQGERERLKRDMEVARDQAIKELWDRTAQLATDVSTKAVGREMNLDDHRRLVDEALAEMRQAVGQSNGQAVY